MNRRLFNLKPLWIPILALAFIFLGANSCHLSPATPAAQTKGLNILLVSIDVLRADHLSSYGYSRKTTPFIDELARESIVFENALSPSQYTLPAHMSILTGVFPTTHGVVDPEFSSPLQGRIKTAAELLSSSGYRTGLFEPFDLEALPLRLGISRGVDEILPYGLKMSVLPEIRYWFLNHLNQKFFVTMYSTGPHDPYDAPPAFAHAFDGKPTHGVENESRSEDNSDWNKARVEFWKRFNLKSPEDIKHLIDLYDGAMKFHDVAFGGLIQMLKDLGLYDKTIIILTSEHGEAFGEHGRMTHATLNQEVLQVPLLVRIPGVRAARVSTTVSLVDILPTLLDLAGVEIEKSIEGKSLLPLIQGHVNEEIHEYLFGQMLGDYLIQNKEWKLIRYGDNSEELYQISKDPKERRNLTGTMPEVEDKLRQKLDSFILERKL